MKEYPTHLHFLYEHKELMDSLEKELKDIVLKYQDKIKDLATNNFFFSVHSGGRYLVLDDFKVGIFEVLDYEKGELINKKVNERKGNRTDW